MIMQKYQSLEQEYKKRVKQNVDLEGPKSEPQPQTLQGEPQSQKQKK